MSRLLLLCAIVTASFGFGYAGAANEHEATDDRVAVAAEKLSREYNRDAAAFTDRYRDKELLVVGTVQAARLFGDREVELTFDGEGARVVGWFLSEEFGRRRGVYLGEELRVKCSKYSDLVGIEAPQITLLGCKVSE